MSGSVPNMQQQGGGHPAGYYDSLTKPGYGQDSYNNGRQDSYRPGSSQRGYDEQRQNSYMQQGSERGQDPNRVCGGVSGGGGGGGGGPIDDRQDSYRQGPPSEQAYRQNSYHAGAPQSEQDYRQDSYVAPPSEQYRQDSYRAPASAEHNAAAAAPDYRQDSYRQAPSEPESYRPNQPDPYAPHPQAPPSEQGSFRPNHVDPYSQGPPSEQESYRGADPYAHVGQFERYGEDEYGRAPPEGVEPGRQDSYIPAGGVPLFPNQHAVCKHFHPSHTLSSIFTLSRSLYRSYSNFLLLKPSVRHTCKSEPRLVIIRHDQSYAGCSLVFTPCHCSLFVNKCLPSCFCMTRLFYCFIMAVTL